MTFIKGLNSSAEGLKEDFTIEKKAHFSYSLIIIES